MKICWQRQSHSCLLRFHRFLRTKSRSTLLPMKTVRNFSWLLKSAGALILLLLVFAIPSFAHTVNYDFSKMSKTEIGFTYLKLGYQHIIPLGIDHILFVTSIFLLNPNLKKVIGQATAFTIAHSITLA